MISTNSPTDPYTCHEIFHKQIVKWLPYVLDSLTNAMIEVLNRRWAVGEEIVQNQKISVDSVIHSP